MERINQFGFYEIGKQLKSVFSLRGDVSPSEALMPLMDCRLAVMKLKDVDFFPLILCRNEVEAIEEVLDRIFSEYFEVVDSSGVKTFRWSRSEDPPIPGWRLNYLRHCIEVFERVFGAELRSAATYYVPRRGIFFTPSLIDEADKTFPAELRSFIPEKTQSEWRQAGRCLAFNLLSASGFHVARSVEGMLESYHGIFCASGRRGPKTWKDYVDDLASELAGQTQASPSNRVIAAITQMKDDYRNPLMHPRVVLSEADARMLLSNGESLIICMSSEIQEAIRAGVVQAPLA